MVLKAGMVVIWQVYRRACIASRISADDSWGSGFGMCVWDLGMWPSHLQYPQHSLHLVLPQLNCCTHLSQTVDGTKTVGEESTLHQPQHHYTHRTD